MGKRLYISIMGTMGSGKTTAARIIAKKLKLHLLEENFGENAFLPRFYDDMKRWAFHSQAFFLMEKISQIIEIPSLLQKKSVMQDTLLQQDVFSYGKAQHTLGNMDDAEWKLYMKIYNAFMPYFPKPDLLIYLETSMPVVVERIKARGRGYEKEIPTSYLELLDMLNHRWLAENKHIPVLTIETDGLNIPRSKVAQKQLIDSIKKKLNV